MTKEELEKEAVEWAKDHHYYNGTVKGYVSERDNVINAYLASAEPREKRIAELEQENKVLAQNLEDTEIVNKALEKENKRLTDELKSLRESIKDYGAGCYENGLRNGKRKLEEQLTKAKDMIKELYEGLDKLYLSGLSDKQIAFIERLQDKVEQFLSEVEK